MGVRYRFDPRESRFTVQAFVGGLLSFLGHSPTFAVRDFRGGLWSDSGLIPDARLEVIVRPESLELVGDASARDREEIESRLRQEVLRTDRYPEVAFRGTEVSATRIAEGQHRLRIGGELLLHGVASFVRVDAQLTVFVDRIRLSGEFALRPSEFGIKPVMALGGTIKLQDQLRFAFDLIGRPEDV